MKPLLLWFWILAVCLGTSGVIMAASQVGHWSDGASLLWGGGTLIGLMIPIKFFIQK